MIDEQDRADHGAQPRRGDLGHRRNLHECFCGASPFGMPAQFWDEPLEVGRHSGDAAIGVDGSPASGRRREWARLLQEFVQVSRDAGCGGEGRRAPGLGERAFLQPQRAGREQCANRGMIGKRIGSGSGRGPSKAHAGGGRQNESHGAARMTGIDQFRLPIDEAAESRRRLGGNRPILAELRGADGGRT